MKLNSEIGLAVLEKKILKYFQYYFTFSLLFSLGKGRSPSFEKLESPPPKVLKYFESKFTISVLSPLGVERGPLLEQTCLIEIGPVVQEKKLKIWKVYRRTDRRTDRHTTDNRRSEKLTWAFSSGELKTLKKNPKN